MSPFSGKHKRKIMNKMRQMQQNTKEEGPKPRPQW